MNKQAHNPFEHFPHLPIFYMLPRKMVERAGYKDFPRNPWEVVASRKWRKLYNSYYFQRFLSDGLSRQIWPGFKMPGGYASYIDDHPLKRFASDPAIWGKVLEKLGYTCELLASMPANIHLHYLAPEAYRLTVSSAWEWYKVFAADENIDIEAIAGLYKKDADLCDFKNTYSKKYQQVHQRYYHTRRSESKKPKRKPYYPDIVYMWQDAMAMRFDVRTLLTTLEQKDRRICQMLADRRTQEEIAGLLGYSNHSGVLKRMRRIRETVERFDDCMRPRVATGTALPPVVPNRAKEEMRQKRALVESRRMPLCKSTEGYQHLGGPCKATGKLVLRAWNGDKDFFTLWILNDGRKVVAYTPTLDFSNITTGMTMRLAFEHNGVDNICLVEATPVIP